MDLATLIAGGFALVVILCLFYLALIALDLAVLRFTQDAPIGEPSRWPSFWGYVLNDLGQRRLAFVARWRTRGRTWARTAWWLGVSLAGAVFIGWWIGGVEYVQSWLAAVFRACSGAALGFLVCRFLLRLNVSEVADRYPAGSHAQAVGAGSAILACALIVGAALIAVALGM